MAAAAAEADPPVVVRRESTAAKIIRFAGRLPVHLVLIALSSTNAGPRYRAALDPALFALAAAALRHV